jgi:hypothetical protein
MKYFLSGLEYYVSLSDLLEKRTLLENYIKDESERLTSKEKSNVKEVHNNLNSRIEYMVEESK